MARLTLSEQRKLARNIPMAARQKGAGCCVKRMQDGEGFMDALKSVGNAIGPIVKVLGPTVLKEILLPLVKQKLSGKGLRLAGQGSGLRLAGQGVKRKTKRKVVRKKRKKK